uniref:Uncharacterized protein n=1 Tax=Elaeophora elaphi TaxID=1147741 RepID=A0A0R3S6S5_9BILA
MEQGNSMEEENESIIRKSFFLGMSFGNDRVKPKKTVKELSIEKRKEKQNKWSSGMIAQQLRRLGDNFEAELQNVYENTYPNYDKRISSRCFSMVKYITDIVIGRLFFN